MKRALPLRRRITAVLAVGAASLLTSLSLSATSASAQVPTSAPSGCASAGVSKVGRIGGIDHAVSTATGCPAGHSDAVHIDSDPAVGKPPLIYHGGPVMSTHSTGPLVVTPIFWTPRGHTMDPAYGGIIARYLHDVAEASGQRSNVFATLNEYYGTNGKSRYAVKLGEPVVDTRALPADGCQVASTDTQGIYADNTGYDACLDDAQVIAETEHIVTTRHMPRDYGHIYVLFLPKHVESCFNAGSTTDGNTNACTINYQPTAAYCAYHSQDENGMVYANMPFPVYHSGTHYTCGSEARGHKVIETPNGNPDADTEVSPTSHEIMEAATDPDVNSGWYDAYGYENGDECAYTYGTMQGIPGQLWNQVINGRHYLTQEEFSNIDFAKTGGGCIQGTTTQP